MAPKKAATKLKPPAKGKQTSPPKEIPTLENSPTESALEAGGVSPTASDISHFRPNWNEGGHEVPLPLSEQRRPPAGSSSQAPSSSPGVIRPNPNAAHLLFGNDEDEDQEKASAAPTADTSYAPSSVHRHVRNEDDYDEEMVDEQQELQAQLEATAQLLAERLNSLGTGKKVSAFEALRAVSNEGEVQITSPSPNKMSHRRLPQGTVMPNGLHPAMYEPTPESPAKGLKRMQAQKQHVAPKLLHKLPDTTLTTLSSHNVGLRQLSPLRQVPTAPLEFDDDASSCASPILSQPHSPTRKKFNLPPSTLHPNDTLATTMQSITTTRGPMLGPAERAARDAKWAVSSSTNHGDDIPDALREKEVELANALAEWRAVEKEFSMHQRMANQMLNSKRELDAINNNHKLDMIRMRQETKVVQARVNSQEQEILKVHDKLRDLDTTMQLSTTKRSKKDMTLLHEVEKLNKELEALSYVKSKEEKEYTMVLESRVKRAEVLALSIDHFDPQEYVQGMLEEQAERLRVEKKAEREAALLAKQKKKSTVAEEQASGSADVTEGRPEDGSAPTTGQTEKENGHSQQHSSPSPQPRSASITSSAISKVDRSPATVKKNKGNLEAFLGGGKKA